jgi:DNA-directed RNA polymerase specialized sigma24 family protein
MDLDVHLPSIVAGDDRAFGAWLAGAEEPVRRSLRSFAAVVDTEAVLQEALLRVWQVAPRAEADGRPNVLLRLALRIARNAAIDEVRRARVAPMDPEDLERALHDAAQVDAPLPDPLLRRVIERCRGKLPPAPRQAFEARLGAGGGRSDRDLAEDVGMQLNTFLKNVGRARALLVECLGRAGVAMEIR